MMRKKGKFWWIGILAGTVLVLAVAGGTALWRMMANDIWVIEANWGISLPREAVFSQMEASQTSPGFHGDGIRYHVFSYQQEEPVERMVGWADAQGRTRFHESYQQAAGEWLSQLSVASVPPYDSCRYWYQCQEDGSELLFFWDVQGKKLYVVESFL